MAALLPLSPSFVSLATANPSTEQSDNAPPSPRVRFDHECVLIPDPLPMSRLPRLVTKSYALPLWKRKRSPSVVSEPEDDPLDDHVVFKVSVPRIVTKALSPSRDAARRPLVSCMVHHDSPPGSPFLASPPRPAIRPRRGSLPAIAHSELVTIPLRACCSQCYPSIDQCMKAGNHWEIHFSRGALRRRKSVSDAHTPSRTRHCLREAMPGFDAVVAVDEVDQRRKSTEVDPLTAFTIEVPATTSVRTSPGTEEIPLRRALSLPDAVHPNRAKLLPDIHPRALAPPIIEEDEHRPSPRRTPISSPLGSTTDLPSTCIVHPTMVRKVFVASDSAKASPTPSPEDSLLDLELDRAFAASPMALTPPLPVPISDKEFPVSYFSLPYTGHGHGRAKSYDSPTSSPSSSPRIPNAHTRLTSTAESTSSSFKRKPLMALPGTIFRASTQVLKGISGMSGPPMAT